MSDMASQSPTKRVSAARRSGAARAELTLVRAPSQELPPALVFTELVRGMTSRTK